MNKRMLLISNSTNYGENYLEWPKQYIDEFLKKTGVRRVLFIPYAGVALSDESLEDSLSLKLLGSKGTSKYSFGVHTNGEPSDEI